MEEQKDGAEHLCTERSASYTVWFCLRSVCVDIIRYTLNTAFPKHCDQGRAGQVCLGACVRASVQPVGVM